MKRFSFPFKAVALALAVVLCGAGQAVLAAGDAAISGRIASLDGGVPIPGATVHAADAKTGEIRSSSPSGQDGTFEVRGLPASSYVLGVESEGGLYVVSAPVALAGGQERSVQLAVGPKAAAQTTEPEKEKKKKAIGTYWDNPLTASLIIVGAAFLVGSIIETDDDENLVVSPSEE